jgi:hypothetical protein
MLIFFRCHRCRSALSVSVAQAGAPYICPACRSEMIVPSSSERDVSHSALVPAPEVASITPPVPSPITAAAMPVAPSAPAAVTPSAPEQPAVKVLPVPTQSRFSPRLVAGGVVVLALLGATGFLAARGWSFSLASDKDQPTEQAKDDAQKPATEPEKETPAAQRPAARSQEHPAEQTQIASLTSQRLDLPSRPRSDVPIKGGAIQQQAPAAAGEKSPASTNTKPAKRLHSLTENELREKLAWATEVGLGAEGLKVFSSYIAHSGQFLQFEGLPRQTDPTPLLQVRPDLVSLPFQNGPNCKLHSTTANDLDTLSRKMRIYLTRLTPVGPDGKRPKPAVLEDTVRREMKGKQSEWLRKQAIPSLMQLLMHEDAPLRQMLVDLLADIPGPEASVSLAKRAVFDLDPDVRQSAVKALKNRDSQHYRPILLRALRYPWAPAADHAAEALVALDDRSAVPELVVMLKRPDPRAPLTLNSRHTVVQELVRANHFTNCLMCHPPSLGSDEAVIGIDPLVALPFTFFSTTASVQPVQGTVPQVQGRPGQATVPQARTRPRRVNVPTRQTSQISIPSSVAQQIQKTAQRVTAQAGCHDYGAAAAGLTISTNNVPAPRTTPGTTTTSLTVTSGAIPVLVRGDITYLRQDFSVQLLIHRPLPARPLSVRFDYLVRARNVPATEVERLRQEFALCESYPQRDAVLFALRELTGKDAGSSTGAWLELFPGAEQDVTASRLTAQLLRASSPLREQLLNKLRDGKGVEYTLALANAIPSLKGIFQEKAREALVERLSRMTAKTLRDKLADDDPEVRRAAVQACQRKEKKELVPELIALLEDPDPLTARTAEAALREMTGEEHETPDAWKEWWADQP